MTVGAYNLKDISNIFKEMSDLGISRLRVWEATGKGNKWRKDKEAKEIFDKCKDAASELGFNFVQSYDPEVVGDVNAHCPSMMKMYMYINSNSELLFCPATEQLLDSPIASFKEDNCNKIMSEYEMFMDTISSNGVYCPARDVDKFIYKEL